MRVTAAESSVDAISDRFVDQTVALDPCLATYLGIDGHDDRMTDFSPEGWQARAECARAALRDLATAEAASGDPAAADTAGRPDRVAAAQLRERLAVELDLYDAGYQTSDLNTAASPLQTIWQTFDLMKTGSNQDWEVIAARMHAVPTALQSYRASLADGARAGAR